MRCLGLVALALAVSLFAGPSIEAGLVKYDVERRQLFQSVSGSPRAVNRSVRGDERSLAIIDEGGGSTAGLVKLELSSTFSVTITIPGFLYFRISDSQGPAADQSGTGSTASSIDWGTLSGWTISGGTWCNAGHPTICPLIPALYMETLDPVLVSTRYDIGTWLFHGTGFTHPGGYISSTQSVGPVIGFGNAQIFLRGVHRRDGTVSALPFVALVGPVLR